jgi:glycosyltransferase involved in cell wall biosynthesis
VRPVTRIVVSPAETARSIDVRWHGLPEGAPLVGLKSVDTETWRYFRPGQDAVSARIADVDPGSYIVRVRLDGLDGPALPNVAFSIDDDGSFTLGRGRPAPALRDEPPSALALGPSAPPAAAAAASPARWRSARPRRPRQREHADGVELAWRGLQTARYEVLVHDRMRSCWHRREVTGTRAVMRLPDGEFEWRVRVAGRFTTDSARRRFHLSATGAVENRRVPVRPGSLRHRLHRPLAAWIVTRNRSLHRRFTGVSKGSLRFPRLVEILVFSWRAARRCRKTGRDTVWVAHDLYSLPVAYVLARLSRGRLVYDAVEMSLGRFRKTSPGWLSRRIILGSERLSRRADCVLAGCPYLSAELAGRHRGVRPILFLNAQDSPRDAVRSDHLRVQTGRPPEAVIVLYVGYISPGRGLEELVRATPHLREDVHLALMGPGAPAYGASLRSLATELEVSDRITILGPVPQEEVVRVASSADIGISPVSREFGNGRYVLNNKLFQYIAAGLPVLASDVEGVGRFVISEGVGDVFDERDPRSIADCINALVGDPERFAEIRARLPAVAARYSGEAQRKILVDAFTRMETRRR